MVDSKTNEQLIIHALNSSKIIALVGVRAIKIEESSTCVRRRPSIIVMKYLQEFPTEFKKELC